jgi:DNA-binding transcriptional LysR family regulator
LPFVKHNLAVGVLPSMFAEEPIKNGEVFPLQVEKEIPNRDILIVYKENSAMSTICRRFIDYLCVS